MATFLEDFEKPKADRRPDTPASPLDPPAEAVEDEVELEVPEAPKHRGRPKKAK